MEKKGHILSEILEKEILVVCILLGSAFFFLYYAQWLNPTFYGYDAFYHSKFIEIMREGIPRDFPWLAASMPNFNDHHFLYHVVLALFFSPDDLLYSGKLSSVVFGTLLSLASYFLLRLLGADHLPALLASLLMLFSSHLFLYRILLVKANVFCLVLILLFIATLFRRYFAIASVIAFLTGWAYVGFPILMYIAVLYLLAVYVQDRKARVVSPIVYVGFALVLSQVINPYFPHTFKEVLEQLSSAGLTRNISGGGEWRGIGFAGLLKTNPVFWYFLGALPVYALGLLVNGKSESVFGEKKWNPEAIFLILFTATLFVLTLKHKRFIEYSLPFSLITGTYLYYVTLGKFRYGKQALVGVLLCCCCWFGWNFEEVRIRNIAGPIEFSKDRYKDAALWLKENSPKGSLVVTADWDDFPLLFFYNTHNVYLLGLDPNFLYKHDPEKYRYWKAFSMGNREVINDKQKFLATFKSNYIFLDNGHKKLSNALIYSPHYSRVYIDAHASVFVVN